MAEIKPISLYVGGKSDAVAVQVDSNAVLDDLPVALGIQSRGAILLVGSATGLKSELSTALRTLFDALAAFAAERGAVCVDGGTQAGIMQILGEARAARGADFPLIGVAPLGTVTWPGRSPAPEIAYQLDYNHSAFVLVEGAGFGAEVDVLAATAFTFAGNSTPVQILAGGGNVSRKDVRTFRARGGPIVVIEGSGRYADELAAGLRAGTSTDSEIQALLVGGNLYPFPLDGRPADFTTLLTRLAGW